jgi:predicted metalloenzyme YecM
MPKRATDSHNHIEVVVPLNAKSTSHAAVLKISAK